jgi:hypothetical protein
VRKDVTTARHFTIFKTEVARCLKLWRIVGWRVETKHEKDSGEYRAQCRTDAKNHVAVLVLSVVWKDDEVTDAKVRAAARHEVVHILVDELDEVAQFRYVTEYQRVHALESVVRHLEELLP